jgi:hypothetical protein
MVATSFEIRPETRFDERVIKPSVIGDLENFSAAILERQSQEKELFKPGLHVCSSCAAVVLKNMGDSEARKFRDRSVLEQCDREGHSDRVEEWQAILHKNRLISDGKAHPKIATRFVACSDKHLKAPDGRRASYRHLPGHGENCRADTEHERITDRLRSVFTNELKALYPDCDITDQLNLKASDDLNQRPDIKFTIKGDTPSGPVDFAIAVEVQQSKIAFDAWENRNQGLLTVATPVVWVFKQSRSGGSFKPILTSMVEGDLPAWVYHIEGEPGSDDGNLILTPAKDGYPNFWGGFDTPNQPKENLVCQNAYHRRRKEIAETYRVGVSGRSEVTLIGGLAQLRSILPGLAAPQSVHPTPAALDAAPAETTTPTRHWKGGLVWWDFSVGSYVALEGGLYGILVPKPREWCLSQTFPSPDPLLYVRYKGRCTFHPALFNKSESELSSGFYRMKNGKVIEILTECHSEAQSNAVTAHRLSQLTFFENPINGISRL